MPDEHGVGETGASTAAAVETAPATRSPATARPARSRARRKRRGGLLRDLPILLLIALVLALLIKTFLVQAFYIPSASMEPTLRNGDRVLVNELAYRSHPPRRGDVIVFRSPTQAGDTNPFESAWHWITGGLGFSGGRTNYIKRVIGLPGETVEITHGVVFIDGTHLDEPYLSPVKDPASYGPYKVPAGDLFVMGDNRTDSGDSRWTPGNGGLGFIPVDHVVGRAFVLLWPPSRAHAIRSVTFGSG